MVQHFLTGVNMLNNPIRICGNDVSVKFRQIKMVCTLQTGPDMKRNRGKRSSYQTKEMPGTPYFLQMRKCPLN